MVTPDPWTHLREFTAARLALGRAGTALPTAPLLDFQLAHARARDAVARPCEFTGLEGLVLASRARDRQEYLRRPDLGRLLAPEAEAAAAEAGRQGPFDLALVVGDGLSSLAVDLQARPLLDRLVPLLEAAGLTLAPLTLVTQARVAVADEVGLRLGARAALILIGERPGLSAPDSLGAYLTWDPRPGRQNSERNCVSNIRPGGLPFDAAARTLRDLVVGARILGESGVGLKEDSWLTAAGPRR